MVYQIITVIMLIKILDKVSKLVELSLFYKADKYNVGAAWINRCTLLKLFCLLQSFQHPYKFKAKYQWSYTVSSKQSTTTATNYRSLCSIKLDVSKETSCKWPSFNVLSCYFYDSLNLVAVPTAWILINFVTQLLKFLYVCHKHYSTAQLFGGF